MPKEETCLAAASQPNRAQILTAVVRPYAYLCENSVLTSSTVTSGALMTSAALLRHTARAACLQTSTAITPSAHAALRYKTSVSSPERRPRNDEIKHHLVQLVDQETGRLNPPTALSAVMASIDRKTHFVELVRESPFPIVKIADKKAAYAAMKRLQRSKKPPISTKEIQLTWCAGAADWDHKLRKVREELEKGNRVDVVFTPKRGKRAPSIPEMEARVQDTLARLHDAGKEWKPREKEGYLIAVHLQGTPVAG